MEISYKRELNHSYMIITDVDTGLTERYPYHMMIKNKIGKLLECRERVLEGKSFLYYDISSRQPLERMYESAKMKAEDLRHIIYSVQAIQEDLAEYLLDEQGLILDTSMLFADLETEELYFCYYPGTSIEMKRYGGLADFFLEHVDHGEEHAVAIAYQFYKFSKSEYFVLSSFLPFLEKESKKQPEETAYQEPFYTQEVEKKQEIDVITDSPETKRHGKKKSFLSFLNRRNHKHKETQEHARQENWPEAVWDSYAGQTDRKTAGDTVYFADLDELPGKASGIPGLKEEGGDRLFRLDHLPLTVGKMKGKAGILLEDGSVSRLHARLEAGGEGVWIQDLNSRNGTLVNGEKLSPNETVPLNDGDRIQFGRERFIFCFIDSKAF